MDVDKSGAGDGKDLPGKQSTVGHHDGDVERKAVESRRQLVGVGRLSDIQAPFHCRDLDRWGLGPP